MDFNIKKFDEKKINNTKKSLEKFKNLILKYETNEIFKLDPSKEEIKFLLDEGLIISIDEIKKNKFKITSSMIKDIFGLLLIEKTSIPNQIINLNDFKIEEILIESIKCFNIKNLIECYNYCSKKNEDQQSYTCTGLKEAVYQFELSSVFRSWFPIDINISIQATISDLKKYPDIFLYCEDKFKIILELLSNERYGPDNRDSSVLGHIKRTINYGKKFNNAIPWIINFITLNNIINYDKIKYPGENNNDYNNDINIVYIFHDKNFNNIKMKFLKINDKNPTIIDIIKKE